MVEDIRKILYGLPPGFEQGVEEMNALLEKFVKEGKLPEKIPTTQIIEDIEYTHRAGIGYRSFGEGQGGEVIIAGEKKPLTDSEYTMLAYLGNDNNFGEKISLNAIYDNTLLTMPQIKKAGKALNDMLQVGLLPDTYRFFGIPSEGYIFMNPTHITSIFENMYSEKRLKKLRRDPNSKKK